jgi:hypothetical protein
MSFSLDEDTDNHTHSAFQSEFFRYCRAQESTGDSQCINIPAILLVDSDWSKTPFSAAQFRKSAVRRNRPSEFYWGPPAGDFLLKADDNYLFKVFGYWYCRSNPRVPIRVFA